MAEPIQVQTGSGKLFVTDDTIRLDAPHLSLGGGGVRSFTIRRSAITGVTYQQTVPSLFGMGGAMKLFITTQDGKTLEVKSVPTKVARQIIEMLG